MKKIEVATSIFVIPISLLDMSGEVGDEVLVDETTDWRHFTVTWILYIVTIVEKTMTINTVSGKAVA